LLNGAFQFSFTGVSGTVFTVLAATNVSTSINDWTALGSATEISPGHFQFIDQQAPGNPQRFYRVRTP